MASMVFAESLQDVSVPKRRRFAWCCQLSARRALLRSFISDAKVVALWIDRSTSSTTRALNMVQRRLTASLQSGREEVDAFEAVEGGTDRVCRGSSGSDDDNSYYVVHGGSRAASLESCKNACVDTEGCRGIEWRPGRCEVWTRVGGIQATAVTVGPVCLRYVPFVLAEGRLDRACRGGSVSDNNPAYYEIMTASRDEFDNETSFFTSSDCKVWTRASGIQTTVQLAGSICLRAGTLGVPDAFPRVDGGLDRACRGQSTSDWSPSYFVYFNAAQAPTLDDCKARCLKNADCKAIDFSSNGCNVWTRPVTTSISFSGSTCLKYEPFVGIDGGEKRGCFGPPPYQIKTLTFPAGEIADQCKFECARTRACQGIEYSSSGCNIWTSNISGSYSSETRTCLRYQPLIPVGGGLDRACSGMDATDAWPSYYSLTSSESFSLASCKTLCLSTIGCKGIQYTAGNCQVWTRRGGIQSSRDQSGSLCLRVGGGDIWEDASAFMSDEGHTCGGEGLTALVHGPERAGSLQDCELRCASMPGCRGVDFGVGGCRTWHGPGVVMAAAEPGSGTCHRFLPFRDVDGGEGRACRGLQGPEDVQSSYYLQRSAASLQDCQDLCVRQSETDVTSCKGVSYDSFSDTCLLWTLAIGATAESPTSVCQRYEPFVEMGVEFGPDGCKMWNRDVRATAEAFGSICLRLAVQRLEEVAESADAFQPVEGGSGRACRGADSTDTN
ncbi:unnamed protein product, partial [Symbiodinium sp. KB8]